MTGSVEMVAVVAMANNRVIGDGNSLIWHLPDDLKRVKALTMGCPLIMGRRTWDSIGRPLPGRASIVMTRDADWAADGALRAGNLDMAVTLARDWMAATADARDEIILFGGGESMQQACPSPTGSRQRLSTLTRMAGRRRRCFPNWTQPTGIMRCWKRWQPTAIYRVIAMNALPARCR